MMINGILIGGKKKRKKTTLKKKRKKKASSTDDFGFLNQSALSLDALMNNFDQDEVRTYVYMLTSQLPGPPHTFVSSLPIPYMRAYVRRS